MTAERGVVSPTIIGLAAVGIVIAGLTLWGWIQTGRLNVAKFEG